MRLAQRGGPGEFATRRARTLDLAASTDVAHPLAVLAAVLEHQQARSQDPTVSAGAALIAVDRDERARAGRYPLLEPPAAIDAVDAGIVAAVDALDRTGVALPDPLRQAAGALASPSVRREAAAAWLTDPALVAPALAFWVGVAAQPVLETAATGVEPPGPQRWTAAACPVCGGRPQVSVVTEESGEFMAGSPRSLVCARCATRWGFRRAVCVTCGEEDSRRIGGWTADRWPAIRIEACDTCRTYIKTFDLRRPGGRDVVPLVDDVASAALDLWAADQGLQRPVRSLAGV